MRNVLATVVCSFSVVPGFALGAVVQTMMYVFSGWTDRTDFLQLKAYFYIERPRLIYELVFAYAVPTGFQAAIAGFVAVWITERVVTDANYKISAAVVGILFGALLIFLMYIVIDYGFAVCILSIEGLGFWLGLASAAATSSQPQRRVVEQLSKQRSGT